MTNKNKNISITPSKGINITITNDFQQPPPPIKLKKKRKYKRKANANLLKMPTMPSFIPQGDVSYIKPQYAATSLNRNMLFSSIPQSFPQLTAPPIQPQLTAPPIQPQLTAPPPVNINFDGMFGSIFDQMMPKEYGFKPQSYIYDVVDNDIMDSLPQAQQDKYIENKVAPQIEKEIKDINFENPENKTTAYTDAVTIKTARTQGTRHANKLVPLDERYKDNEYYIQNYIGRLQEILIDDSTRTKPDVKAKATELLKSMGMKPPTAAAAPPAAAAKPPKLPKPAPASEPVEEVEAPLPPAKPTPNPQGGLLAPSGGYPAAAQSTAAKPPPPPPPPPPAAVAPPNPQGGLLAPSGGYPAAAKPVVSTALLSTLEDTPEEIRAKEKAAKESEKAAQKGSMLSELIGRQEQAPKQAGTRNGKNLSIWSEKYIDNLNYRKNYISELELIKDNRDSTEQNKQEAVKLLNIFNDELIKRAKEYAIKDTSLDTLNALRPEYKEFKEEYLEPYIKKMKEHKEETEEKLKNELEKLKGYKEMDKPEIRKTLEASKKKKLTKLLEDSENLVNSLKDLLEKIKGFSGLV